MSLILFLYDDYGRTAFHAGKPIDAWYSLDDESPEARAFRIGWQDEKDRKERNASPDEFISVSLDIFK